jgi:hypothetical protein
VLAECMMQQDKKKWVDFSPETQLMVAYTSP